MILYNGVGWCIFLYIASVVVCIAFILYTIFYEAFIFVFQNKPFHGMGDVLWELVLKYAPTEGWLSRQRFCTNTLVRSEWNWMMLLYNICNEPWIELSLCNRHLKLGRRNKIIPHSLDSAKRQPIKFPKKRRWPCKMMESSGKRGCTHHGKLYQRYKSYL